MKNKQILKIAENLGWSIYRDETGYELSQYSDAGEDFSFCVDKRGLADNIEEYAEGFDVEEHAIMWYNAERRGQPDSLLDLLNDARGIKNMLNELVAAISGDGAGVLDDAKLDANAIVESVANDYSFDVWTLRLLRGVIERANEKEAKYYPRRDMLFELLKDSLNVEVEDATRYAAMVEGVARVSA